ncbi:hypothetical protein DES39_0757 [Orbus hercynius]|uniref:Uncharacterized protein n=1 Tax=Orbus hercynius TaxID=593135 RepID=A0A495RJ10_9GAMM|nr:hypothetical protein [Orbus hercynius]RKS87522.1 hypothetical protein DES39_0757 [Orbus hercynius]
MGKQIKADSVKLSQSKQHQQRFIDNHKSIIKTRHYLSSLSSLINIGLISTSLVSLPLLSFASLSVTTSQTIQGSAPYFLLDNGTEKLKILTTDELIGFQYIDESGNVVIADKSMDGKVIQVNTSMNQRDLLAVVPIDGKKYSLSEMLTMPDSVLLVSDTDGDAKGADATGFMTATLRANSVKTVVSDTLFDWCKGTYTLEISATADTSGNLQAKTMYGDPYYRDYETNTATYTLQPAGTAPYVCWAQPNLRMGTDQYAGPASQWDPSNGFLLQSLDDPTKNFPTTGFNNAYFYLVLVGTTAKQVIASTTGASGLSGTYTPVGTAGIYAELSAMTANTNLLMVKLKGPDMNSATIPMHSATVFNLQSGTDMVYRFSIDKWFIARAGINGGYKDSANPALNYCTDLGGGGKYKVPSVVGDYTNASIEAGVNGNYQRTIGGGLFAEWGYTANNYTDSGFEVNEYWASESVIGYDDDYQYIVSSVNGSVNYTFYADDKFFRAACVSPL